jgi:hypothetical protein
MIVPTVFIVGAPRCGTSSLNRYLAAHPKLFMAAEKEPHHFGADLGLRRKPYGDRKRYLEIFEAAGPDRQGGEASVLYLYSRDAPREILELSPSARIVIMLRDPFEMIPSLHEHNRLLLYEDIPDLDAALDAEADRREGRRIPRHCIPPLALQYTALGRYTDHVRRYQDAFGPERVKVILFDDFKADAARVHRETLEFLGLEPIALPEYKTVNSALGWRSQRVASVFFPLLLSGTSAGLALPRGILRNGVILAALAVCYLPLKMNARTIRVPPPSAYAKDRIRRAVTDDVDRLGTLLGRDLSSWLGGTDRA